MAAGNVEQRLSALEAEVARLKECVKPTDPMPWWEKISGTFLNDPYYEKAMNYGRKYRESLKPRSKKRRKPQHEDP